MTLYRLFALLAICVSLDAAVPGRAHAYIDPGTGSMLVQALIAAVTAVGVSVGIFWSRIKSLLGRFRGRGDDRKTGTDGD